MIPGLMGPLPPMSPALASKMQWLALNNTGELTGRCCWSMMLPDTTSKVCILQWTIDNGEHVSYILLKLRLAQHESTCPMHKVKPLYYHGILQVELDNK